MGLPRLLPRSGCHIHHPQPLCAVWFHLPVAHTGTGAGPGTRGLPPPRARCRGGGLLVGMPPPGAHGLSPQLPITPGSITLLKSLRAFPSLPSRSTFIKRQGQPSGCPQPCPLQWPCSYRVSGHPNLFPQSPPWGRSSCWDGGSPQTRIPGGGGGALVLCAPSWGAGRAPGAAEVMQGKQAAGSCLRRGKILDKGEEGRMKAKTEGGLRGQTRLRCSHCEQPPRQHDGKAWMGQGR